jgi:hypothetical protein
VYASRWLRKVREWSARYLPAEVVGTVFAVAGAWLAYEITGDRAIAAITGTMAENIGFYGVMAVDGWRSQTDAGQRRRVLRTVLALFAEFGPAEALDSLLVRPLCMYIGPFLTGGIAGGSLLGKLAADAVFYAVAIVSYEIVQRRRRGRVAAAMAGAPVGSGTEGPGGWESNGGRLAPAGMHPTAGDRSRRGGRGVPGHDHVPARGRVALRHEMQRLPAGPDPAEGPRVPVRDRVGG